MIACLYRLSSFLKDLFFCRNLGLIFKAYRQKYISLPQLLSANNSYNPEGREEETRQFIEALQSISGSKMRFVKLIILTDWREWILIAFLSIVSIVFIGLEPYLSSLILALIKDPIRAPSNIIKVVSLLFVSKVIKSLISIHLYYRQYRLGLKLYVDLSLAIHNQSLNHSKASQLTPHLRGKSLTLLEQDCNKLITFPYFLCQIILSTIQIGYGLTFLTVRLPKCNFLMGYYILLIYFIITLMFAFVITSLVGTMLQRKDKRLALTFTGLESYHQSAEEINEAREKQIESLTSVFHTEILFRSAPIFFTAFFLSVTLIWNYNNLSVQELYMIILLFNQISYPISSLPFVVQNFTQLLVNLNRVLGFVQTNEEHLVNVHVQNQIYHKQYSKELVQFKKVGEVSWDAIKFYAVKGNIFLLIAFIAARVIVQISNAASSLLNKDLSKPAHHNLIQFFNPFLPVIPFCLSFFLIIKLSLNVSHKIHPLIAIKNEQESKAVIMNLLSNDLRVIDRVIAINTFDFFSSILSIIRSIALSMYTVSLNNKSYALYMTPVILGLISVLVLINRGFMWVRRQCTRLQGISKTPFIDQFYQSLSTNPQPTLNRSQKQTFSRLHQLLSETTKISLSGMYFQSWYQLVLITLSLLMLITLITVSSLILTDSAMLGFIFSHILLLDNIIRDFFITLVTIQRNSISLERLYNIVRTKESAPEEIKIQHQS